MLPCPTQVRLRFLVITARNPWPSHTGDRLRAAIWVAALARHGEVTLVAGNGGDFPARRSPLAAGRSLVRWLRNRLPFQCLLAAPYDWRSAIQAAEQERGPFDATVVLLSRIDPWVRHLLPGGRSILDAVDSLRRSADERRKAAGWATRWLWQWEARRMARLETEAVATYGRVVVVSEEEAPELRATAVPNGIDAAPLADAPRAFDFGFWGRLPYFANADAATWLLDELWPAIRARRPQSTLVLGGAGASPSLRAKAERLGVTVVSPIADVAAFARNIRVALMPLRYGSGQSNKVLEAAEGGCAIAGTPAAFRGLAPLAAHAAVASTTEDFARAAIEQLERRDHRLREVVTTQYARAATLERLAAIAMEGGR